MVDICWNILGTVWAFGNVLDETHFGDTLSFVKSEPVVIILCIWLEYVLDVVLEDMIRAWLLFPGFTVCNWISVGILTLLALYLYDPLGTTDFSGEASMYRNIELGLPTTSRSQQWNKQCQSATCLCLHREHNVDPDILEGFHQVSSMALCPPSFLCAPYIEFSIKSTVVVVPRNPRRPISSRKCVSSRYRRVGRPSGAVHPRGMQTPGLGSQIGVHCHCRLCGHLLVQKQCAHPDHSPTQGQ